MCICVTVPLITQLVFTWLSVAGENIKIVETPPFAESVSEGDVRWDKGKKKNVSFY